jgi:hypothetical protein
MIAVGAGSGGGILRRTNKQDQATVATSNQPDLV